MADDVLFSDFRQRLKITWEDEKEDRTLKKIIESGKQYLNEIAGTEIDFNTDMVAYELLYNYVLYSRSDSIAVYRREYSSDFLRLRTKYKARRIIDSDSDGDTVDD